MRKKGRNFVAKKQKVCLFSKDKIMLMSISKTERVCLNKVQQQRSFAFSLFFFATTDFERSRL